MRASTQIVMCDAENGMCGNWDADNYETGASTINGIRITATHRALGWTSTKDEDLCPEHASEKAGE